MTASPLNVAVIGSGTLGMCTAYSLAEQGVRVRVLDAQTIASGSSGRSVGVVETQVMDSFGIMLRSHSLRQLHRWERLGLGFNHIGYLRLARTTEQMDLFAKSIKMQEDAGFRARLYQVDELQKLVPHLNPNGLEGGLFGPDDGFLDPHEMCTFLADKVRNYGGQISQFCQLLNATRQGDGYKLRTSKGDVFCDFVVNAAGAWAPAVAEIFGQTLHIHPERHEAIAIHLDEPLPYTMPMVMDLVNGEGTGLNFRHERTKQLMAEIHKPSSDAPEDPDNYNDQCDEGSKVNLAELLLERVPDLPGASLGKGWAGLYPVTSDSLPFIGTADSANTRVITAAGAGGYGIQLAPVIGIIAADWVLHGAPVSIPCAKMLCPTAERNVPLRK